MKSVFKVIGVALLLGIAYLSFWPIPIQPLTWDAPAQPGYSGPHAPNNKLANLQMIDLGAEVAQNILLSAAMESCTPRLRVVGFCE